MSINGEFPGDIDAPVVADLISRARRQAHKIYGDEFQGVHEKRVA